ncbi:MAG: SDR family oxidoreductase [Sphingomonadales bacterium]|uniref:SDR family oxidoreductase n=1 Tax=unclassified Novosphingobium TaxID=2644732 RepID=UPI000A939CDE|nr:MULTISPECIES: SDR family NAD(P)-dependent oxidoreductase [unclassified Novosphingobium]MBU6393379.1 SDR family oxidoreductase [Sphingomonadales bacterium]
MRAALVSGAGIGIGAATAKILGREGYHVIVSDILKAEGEAVAEEIRAAGGSAEHVTLDVGDTEACDAVIADIDARFGALSALVANAGIAPRAAYPILTDGKWDEVLNVNLKGQLRLIRAAAPAMSARQQGAIVCVSSIAGAVVGWDDHWHYSAAKAGITGMVKAAACELAKANVRVNAVAPGFIRTAQILSEENSLGPEGLAAAETTVPLRRAGHASEIGEVIAFLLSDKASYVTGQTIVVDGGLTVAL